MPHISAPALTRWRSTLTPEQKHDHAVRAGKAHRLTGFARVIALRNLYRPTRAEALARLAKAHERLALRSRPRLR